MESERNNLNGNWSLCSPQYVHVENSSIEKEDGGEWTQDGGLWIRILHRYRNQEKNRKKVSLLPLQDRGDQ